MNRTFISRIGMVCAAVVLVWGCGGPPERDQELAGREPATAEDAAPRSDAASETDTTAVADITGEPEGYVGRTVTIEADVEEVWTGYAFSLDEDAPFEGGVDNDLLVFTPKAANLTEIDDQWVNNKARVTGTVRMMSAVELEREIGWDLDPELEIELETVRPVLIASSVVRADAPY